MGSVRRRGGVVLGLFAALTVFAAGCGKGDGKQAGPEGKESKDGSGKPKTEQAKHDGWWCEEHGIPEAECSMCSKKVADACKAKGDWCAKHNRARTQCFKCEPKLKEVFAAKYRAHFNGKEPPPISDDD